jgi:hypothetical protein
MLLIPLQTGLLHLPTFFSTSTTAAFAASVIVSGSSVPMILS